LRATLFSFIVSPSLDFNLRFFRGKSLPDFFFPLPPAVSGLPAVPSKLYFPNSFPTIVVDHPPSLTTFSSLLYLEYSGPSRGPLPYRGPVSPLFPPSSTCEMVQLPHMCSISSQRPFHLLFPKSQIRDPCPRGETHPTLFFVQTETCVSPPNGFRPISPPCIESPAPFTRSDDPSFSGHTRGDRPPSFFQASLNQPARDHSEFSGSSSKGFLSLKARAGTKKAPRLFFFLFSQTPPFPFQATETHQPPRPLRLAPMPALRRQSRILLTKTFQTQFSPLFFFQFRPTVQRVVS